MVPILNSLQVIKVEMTMKNQTRNKSILFENFVSNSNIQENSFTQSKNYHNLSDPVRRAMARYKHQPNVLLIQSNISNRNKFSFSAGSKSDVEKEIKNSSLKKVITKNNIPPRILKESDKVSSNIFKETCKQCYYTW